MSILIVDAEKYAFTLRSNRICMSYVSHNLIYGERVGKKLKDLQEGVQKFNQKEEFLELKKGKNKTPRCIEILFRVALKNDMTLSNIMFLKQLFYYL